MNNRQRKAAAEFLRAEGFVVTAVEVEHAMERIRADMAASDEEEDELAMDDYITAFVDEATDGIHSRTGSDAMCRVYAESLRDALELARDGCLRFTADEAYWFDPQEQQRAGMC